MRFSILSSFSFRFQKLSSSVSQIAYVLLTRSPLDPKVPFDLHVLGAPPAFVLSQDQTLQSYILIYLSIYFDFAFACHLILYFASYLVFKDLLFCTRFAFWLSERLYTISYPFIPCQLFFVLFLSFFLHTLFSPSFYPFSLVFSFLFIYNLFLHSRPSENKIKIL